MDRDYPMKFSKIDTSTDQADQGENQSSVPADASQVSQSFSIPRKPIGKDAKRVDGKTALIGPSETIQHKSRYEAHPGRTSIFRWWLPEIFASVLSVACLVCIVIVLRKYDHRALDSLNFPTGLTLNGVIALIATINRVALMVPVGSSLSQEAWLWFSPVTHQKVCPTRLRDLELSDDASRGAWGSLIFLLYGRHRYVSSKSTLNEC